MCPHTHCARLDFNAKQTEPNIKNIHRVIKSALINNRMATTNKKLLYVGGLAEEVDEKMVHAAFIPFGDIIG